MLRESCHAVSASQAHLSVSVRYEYKKLRTILWDHEQTQDVPEVIKASLKPRIYSALSKVIARYPSLAVCLVDDQGPKAEPRFQHIPTLDLDKIVRFQKGGNVAGTLEHEHNEPFNTEDKGAPLWRLTVTFDTDGAKADEHLRDKVGIVFVYHHAIGDGSSGRNFHNELVRHLNKVDEAGSESIVKTIGGSLPTSLEESMHFKPTTGVLLKTAINELVLPSFIKARIAKTFWTGDVATTSPPKSGHTAVACLAIPAGQASSLYALCKENGVTVHSALYIVSLMAAWKTFQPGKGVPMHFKTATPLSLRTECNVPSDDFGVYVCGYTDAISVSQAHYQTTKEETVKSFWTHCKDYKSRLTKGRRDAISYSSMLAYVPKGKWEEFFRSAPLGNALTNGRSSSFEVSNLGVWSPPTSPTDEWIPKAARFSQCANPLTDVMTIGVLSLADGPLTATITWQEGEIRDSRSRMNSYIKEWERLISTLMSGDKLPMLLIT